LPGKFKNSYTIDDNGSHSKMIGKHIGKMLSEQMYQRWVQLLLVTADWLKADPEFRSAFVGLYRMGHKIGSNQFGPYR
jgi:hemoglobin